MRFLNDPQQTALFDVFKEILSPVAYRKLQSGWQHLFRCAILKLLPANKLAEHFHPEIGRPTKELYSMAGLLFVMEFRDWTHEEAADAYMFNVDIQDALNLAPERQSLCRRTIERYIRLFREDELAANIMCSVTDELVKLLELDVSKQRLDSTHIESNMAKFGRIKLMTTAIRRFLIQVRRHDEGSYNRLKKAIRERYEAPPNSLFGWKQLDSEEVDSLRQSVAEDLLYLVERYRKNRKHNTRPTYLALAKVLEQQCDVVDDKPDSKAIAKLVHEFEEHGHRPKTLLADTAYGSDANFVACARNSTVSYSGPTISEVMAEPVIELVSPTSGKANSNDDAPSRKSKAGSDSSPLTILDFTYDDGANRFTHCPAGHELHRAHYREFEDQHLLLMLGSSLGPCQGCPMAKCCPIQRGPMLCELRVNGKDLRLTQRRAKEKTDAFREAYRKRSGIEATNAMLKRVTGLGRLRVRGRPAVTMSVLLKVAGWNLLRAASVRSLIGKLAKNGHAAQSGKLSGRMRALKSPGIAAAILTA